MFLALLLRWASLLILVARNLFIRVGIEGVVEGSIALLVSADPVALWNESKAETYKIAVDAVRDETTLELDPLDPLSDASFSAAITTKSGVNITSVRSIDVLVRDLSAHVSGLLALQTGVTLTNVLSVEQVKVDVVDHALKLVTQQTGINMSGAKTLDDVKSRVTKHVETQMANLAVKHIERAVEEFSNPEATIEELLALVFRGSEAKELKTTGVALGVAAGILVRAYSEMSAPIKRKAQAFRRRAQNREAQRRFRELHGLRMRYNKLTPGGAGGTGGTGG